MQELIITHASSDFCPHPATFPLALAGDHQLENGTVALAALAAAQPHLPRLTLAAVRAGLATVAWNGRLQTLYHAAGAPTLLADCAHNAYSAARLRQALEHHYTFDRLCLIFGATEGKDVDGMLSELLPLAAHTIATISTHPRASAPADIAALAAGLGCTVETSPDISEAVKTAWRWAASGDLICVTGSIFVVGDLLNQWENLQTILLRQDEPLAKATAVLE